MVDFDTGADGISNEINVRLRGLRDMLVNAAKSGAEIPSTFDAAIQDLGLRTKEFSRAWQDAEKAHEEWVNSVSSALSELIRDRQALRSRRPPPGSPLPRPAIDYAFPESYGNPSISGGYPTDSYRNRPPLSKPEAPPSYALYRSRERVTSVCPSCHREFLETGKNPGGICDACVRRRGTWAAPPRAGRQFFVPPR